MFGQCCNFQGINSKVEISWDILSDYRLRHLVNNVAMHMITLEWRLTVLYLKISWHQLSISLSQISAYWLRYRVASKLYLRPSNLQLMPWNFKIQHSYLLNMYKLKQEITSRTIILRLEIAVLFLSNFMSPNFTKRKWIH